MSKSQTAAVLALLRERGQAGITPMDGLHVVGSMRLGARIFDLRAQGYVIRTERFTTPNGAVVARYVLEDKPEQQSMGLTA